MVRVVGCDPGTSSLDLLLLDHGVVAGQARLDPQTLQADPERLVKTLRGWGPVDLIAGPSGYGLPLVRVEDVSEADLDRMAHIRAADRGRSVGVLGFRGWVRSLLGSGLPVIFLPGGIQLPTVPAHRKVNAIDLGTADKVAVVALALHEHRQHSGEPLEGAGFGVVEIGSAFSAVLVVDGGRLVDAAAGTRGPIGLRCGGAWDGEVAYALSPLSKADLFHGGVADLGEHGAAAFRESLRKHVAGLRAVTPFERIYLSGAGLDQGGVASLVCEALDGLGQTIPLPSLPGAWVKQAAQGAALLADGLAGGTHRDLVEALELRNASGTIEDMIRMGRRGPAPSG